jgi:hypothetical protein
MTNVADDPARWRKRAEEARTQAAQMTDEEARRGMLSIAEGYERMARFIEQRSETLMFARMPGTR